MKNTLIQNIKKEIRKADSALYDLLEKNKISDDQIYEHAEIILEYLENRNQKTAYSTLFKVEDGVLVHYSVAKSNEAKKLIKANKLLSRYTTKEIPLNKLQIDLNENVDQTKNRISTLEKIKVILEKYPDNKKGLWITGKSGTGKTTIAFGILNWFANKGYSVAYISLPEFISKIKNNFKNYDYDINNDWEAINNSDILVVDNIGSELLSSWSRDEVLLTLLNNRIDFEKLVFFTSNISIKKYQSLLNSKRINIADENLPAKVKENTDTESIIKDIKTNTFAFKTESIISKINSLVDEVEIK